MVIAGDISPMWAVVTDVDNWPIWNPHEEVARLAGPFMVGTKGWSKPKGALAAKLDDQGHTAPALGRGKPDAKRKEQPL